MAIKRSHKPAMDWLNLPFILYFSYNGEITFREKHISIPFLSTIFVFLSFPAANPVSWATKKAVGRVKIGPNNGLKQSLSA